MPINFKGDPFPGSSFLFNHPVLNSCPSLLTFSLKMFLPAEWIVIRIRASPDAGRLGKLVALHAKRTAVRQYPRRVGEHVSRIKHLGLQRHFAFDVVAKTNFTHFPYMFSHRTSPELPSI
jgi:hypothetical protein